MLQAIRDGGLTAERKYPQPKLAEKHAIDAYMAVYSRHERQELIITAGATQFTY